MKTIGILQTVLLTAVMAAAISCSPSREYSYDRYPSPRTSLSLIISPRQGLMISMYSDGRYYYRSPEGYVYWRGYDDRYYLDRTYLNRGHYDNDEYNEWRYHGKKYKRRGWH